MSNPMRYIRTLEAAGFPRDQAEAQVQMVLDVLEGDLVTKSDFTTFQKRFRGDIGGKIFDVETKFDKKFVELDKKFVDLENKFALSQQSIQIQIKESEFRLTTRLGFMMVSTMSIAVAVLTWLIKS